MRVKSFAKRRDSEYAKKVSAKICDRSRGTYKIMVFRTVMLRSKNLYCLLFFKAGGYARCSYKFFTRTHTWLYDLCFTGKRIQDDTIFAGKRHITGRTGYFGKNLSHDISCAFNENTIFFQFFMQGFFIHHLLDLAHGINVILPATPPGSVHKIANDGRIDLPASQELLPFLINSLFFFAQQRIHGGAPPLDRSMDMIAKKV